jgi:hypothetical protein
VGVPVAVFKPNIIVECGRGHVVNEPPDLPSAQRRPCRAYRWRDVCRCGSLERRVIIEAPGTIEVGPDRIVSVTEYVVRRWKRLLASFAIGGAGAAVGHLVAGWAGVAIGLLTGVAAWFVRRGSETRVQRIDSGEPLVEAQRE